MAERPRAIDLFCGAGGLSTGLEWAGFEVIWATDKDPEVEQTYADNHDASPTIGDIRELSPADIPVSVQDLSLVAGGPPCPTFSSIGKSKINSLGSNSVLEDDRHYLFEDFLRFVEALEPAAFLMENVVNLESSTGVERRHIIDEIGRLSSDAGYGLSVQSLDAADYGVPQHRNRIFLIGERSGRPNPDLDARATHREPVRSEESDTSLLRGPSAYRSSPQVTLGDFGATVPRPSGPNDREPWITVGEAVLDLPAVCPDSESQLKTADYYTIPPFTEYQRWARDVDDVDDWSKIPLSNHTSRGHNNLDLTIYKLLGEGTGWNIGKVSQDLQPYRADIFRDKYRKLAPRKPSPTILAHLEKDGHMFIHPREARSITVREAARLQSFPDSFEFRESMVNNFRLVGNAVPPLLGKAIGEAIREDLVEITN